ncbi:MAG: class I SAM-dependent methyltransferase [Ignavibacteriota bacterium]
MQKTDYAQIAATYNNRYKTNYLAGIENEIKKIVSSNNYNVILEAGCGTGRWINLFENSNQNIFGLDFSLEMVKIPKTEKSQLNFVNADAINIPFKDNFYDLIFCVNAIHHFSDKLKFIQECKRTLSTNGMIAVFGVDPTIDKDWYVYNYFDSVYENDLKRFPTLDFLRKNLEAEKFVNVEIKSVEEVNNIRIGSDVFNDPFLQKHHCSQLANLTNEEYENGILKIKKQVEQNPKTVFTTSVIFYLVSAKKK